MNVVHKIGIDIRVPLQTVLATILALYRNSSVPKLLSFLVQ